jgi:hypothetical protein
MRANTTTGLTVAPNGSAQQGQLVTLTATVSLSGDPSAHPQGSVTFYNKSARLNSTPIIVDPSTGEAKLTVADLPPSGPGHTVLSATFQPSDSTVNSSISPAVAYTVNPVATRPTVSGRARVGATDRCSEPTRAGETAAYSWLAGHRVVAKKRSYTVGAVALHRMLRCRVALSIGKGKSSVATSTGRKVVRGPVLKVTSKPKLRGPHRVGKTESVTVGKWHPRASAYTFQWYVGHKKIHHGAKRKLVVKRALAGKRLSCRVTARRRGFAKGHATTKRVKVSR